MLLIVLRTVKNSAGPSVAVSRSDSQKTNDRPHNNDTIRSHFKNSLHTPLHTHCCSQMALFYISACIHTGSCSQPQRPFTHQSKKLLCCCSPSPHQVSSLPLALHILCAFSPTSSFSQLILHHKIQSCPDSLPPPPNHFHTCPLYPVPSHSLFLQVFYILLHCLHLHGHTFNPSRLRFYFPLLRYTATESSVLKSNEHVLRLLFKTVLHASA